jgi:DNA repair exonuclease SbcCD ATPase subunit
VEPPMEKKPKAKAAAPQTGDSSDLDNVDKIRDILFGNQMRDFDKKFNQLEDRISTELNNLRKENALQMDSLQTFIEGEIEILSNKLSAEESTRIENMDDLDSELKKSAKQLDKKIADLSKALDTQSRDSNQKMLKQSQDFNGELNKQIEQTRKRMDDYKQELSSTKTDKSVLAEMFNSLALQINAEE